MRELLRKGSTIVVLGPGGVGKTTVAAALGLAAAQLGLDTALITIDPARRLREALGMERLTAQPVRLDLRRMRAAGLDTSARLSVTMLDVKGTWDAMVEEVVRTPEARERILQNPFYRSLTQQFAGAEAYAALEQLSHLHRSGRFDLEIVDTPPAAHAFEFFDAPRHLMRLLDSSALRWSLKESAVARNALTIMGRAASFVIGQLEHFTGTTMLSALSEFVSFAAEAAGDLSDRFRAAEAMLHSARVSFVLATTAAEDRLSDAVALVARAERQKLNLRGIVINRLLDERTFNALARRPPRWPGHLADAVTLRNALHADAAGDSKFAELAAFFEEYVAHQRRGIERSARFAQGLSASTLLAIAPAVELGVRDLPALAKLGSMLTRPPAGRKFLEDAAAAFGIPLSSQQGRAAPQRTIKRAASARGAK